MPLLSNNKTQTHGNNVGIHKDVGRDMGLIVGQNVGSSVYNVGQFELVRLSVGLRVGDAMVIQLES